MIDFSGTPRRSGTWSWFKPLVASKSIVVQYEEEAGVYVVFGYDVPEALSCTIWTGTVPAGVVAAGYSQAQNDADKTDFDVNFKPYANRSIDSVPSRVMATTIRAVIGGAQSLAVDGSGVPVVYEYNPPSNYEIEVTALSILFEGGAMAFGNRFILDALSSLSNGLLLEGKTADLAFNWQNMKRTRDVVEIAEDFDIVTGTVSLMRVRVHLPQALRLARAGTYVTPDYLRLTVRDDLSAFSFAEAHFQGVKL